MTRDPNTATHPLYTIKPKNKTIRYVISWTHKEKFDEIQCTDNKALRTVITMMQDTGSLWKDNQKPQEFGNKTSVHQNN